jgi:hypothetical protein
VSESSALRFLRAAQHADGAWGYRPGGVPVVEPAAFALLALAGDPESAAAHRLGLDALAAQQRGDGGFGAFPGDTQASWMTGLAALALRGRPEAERALDWLVNVHRLQPRFSGDPEPLRRVAGFDPFQRGWPWALGDATWTEPTAVAVAALAAGGRRDTPEVAAGVAFLLDRACPDGGWNVGNPLSVGKPMRSEVPFTGQTLLALRAAGIPTSEPKIAAGLAFLRARLPDLVTPYSISWAHLALATWGASLPDRPALAPLQSPDGSYDGNVHATALALLAARPPANLPWSPP